MSLSSLGLNFLGRACRRRYVSMALRSWLWAWWLRDQAICWAVGTRRRRRGWLRFRLGICSSWGCC